MRKKRRRKEIEIDSDMLDVKKTIALGKQWCLIKMMRSKKKREREFSFLLCVCSHFGVGVQVPQEECVCF